MPKISFKFFEVNVKEDEVEPFLQKMEEVVKEFAGQAYHFRYYIEGHLLEGIIKKTKKTN